MMPRSPAFPRDLYTRRIFRLAVGVCLTGIATALIGFRQAWPSLPWHALAAVGVQVVVAGLAALSARLAYQRRVPAASRLLILAVLGVLPLPVLWLEGLGPAYGVLAGGLAALVAALGLTGRENRWWLLVSAGLAVTVGLIDWWWPGVRYPPFTGGEIFLPTVLLVLGIGIAIVRQYRWLPLRVQLVLAAAAATGLPVLVLAFGVAGAWQRSLAAEMGNTLHGLAETQAGLVAHNVAQNLDRLQALSVDRELAEAAEAGAPHLGGPDASRTTTLHWQASASLQFVLTNEAAQELAAFQARYPGFAELFITDRHGALVAASQPTSDFYQADENWWQAAWSGGQGAIYVARPAFDVSSQVLGLALAMPLRNTAGAVVGVLRATASSAVISQIVADTAVGRLGRAELWLPNAAGYSQGQPLALTADQLAQLTSSSQSEEITIDNEPLLVAVVPVELPTTSGPDDPSPALGWHFLVYQPRAESLAAIVRPLSWAGLLVVSLIILSALIAAVFAQQLGNAIAQIGTAVELVRTGDLTARTGFREQTGDLPRLAAAVDHMAESLEQRALESRHSDAEIKRQSARVGVLLQSAGRLAAQLDEEALWEVIGEEVAHALSVPVVSLSLYDLASDSFRFVYSRGLPPGVQAQARVIPAELFAVRAAPRPTTTHVLTPWSTNPSPGADQLARAALRTLATVELWHNQQLVGRLQVCALAGDRRLSADEELLLLGLGHQAALAIANSQLYTQARRRSENLVALRNIDRAIIAGPDLSRNLEVVLDQIISELRIDAVAVLLFDAERQRLHNVADRGLQLATPHRGELPLGQGLAGRAAEGHMLLEVADLRVMPEPDEFAMALIAAGFVAYVAVPLMANTHLVGVLELFHRQPLEVDAEWRALLETLAGQGAIAVDSAQLFLALHRSNDELTQAYEATLAGWSHALDLRDRETEGHTQRVTAMSVQLAQHLGLTGEALVHIRRGALLHDIGKMGVPDAILLKAGPLTSEEFAIMRQHPQKARDLLGQIGYLAPSLDIPFCHHEKWDGTGYPQGLRGEAIPYAARLFALVDVWDALRSDRPYRPAWSIAATRDYIRARAGTHFDPALVEPFLAEVCPPDAE